MFWQKDSKRQEKLERKWFACAEGLRRIHWVCSKEYLSSYEPRSGHPSKAVVATTLLVILGPRNKDGQ